MPFVVAANGRRSLHTAARFGDGWVTVGTRHDTLEDWWGSVAEMSRRFEDAMAEVGRDPAAVPRYLALDAAPGYALSSAGRLADEAARAAEIGFTDVITVWPRRDRPYAADESVLETVAAEVLPRFREHRRGTQG